MDLHKIGDEELLHSTLIEILLISYKKASEQELSEKDAKLARFIRLFPQGEKKEGIKFAIACEVLKKINIPISLDALAEHTNRRSLCEVETEDGYDDLHGRALEALVAQDRLCLECLWKVEKKHREYAPLVLALIISLEPELIPTIVADIIEIRIFDNLARILQDEAFRGTRQEVIQKLRELERQDLVRQLSYNKGTV